jgi:hypothetical protein
MKSIEKELQSFNFATTKTNEILASESLNSASRDDASFNRIDPKLIEAYLTGELAKLELLNRKPIIYQITICVNSNSSVNFQMSTIPHLGEEVTVLQQNGKEQVYKVIKIRHNAYGSDKQLQQSSKSAAVIWGELINNPAKIAAVY